MAATFNSDLSFKEGEITARELRVAGLQWNFSPVMDLGRQPLWPRLWETYGEDVHLATIMGTAYIKGHQGDDFSAPTKGLTCLKHYVGYSFPINGKDRTPAWISERMLREYFLPPFEAAIKAGAPTIMVNSAEVDGIPGHANYQYLTTILRDELGFKGFTVSDWEDIKRLYTRDKLAANEKEAVKIAVMAGIDMSMVPFDYSFYHLLLELVNTGEVPLARINEAVTRILGVKYRAGLFNSSTPLLSEAEHFATAQATDINRQAARESIVLAKNEHQSLPLKKSANVLVAGPNANLLNVMNGGWTLTWQGDDESLYPKDKLTLFKAIQKKATGQVTYLETSPLNQQAALDATKNVDVIVLCLGEKPYTETVGNIGSLNLEATQVNLANAMLATGKKVILIMTGGRPRIITEQAELASAVILGFLPGMEGGEAIADILYGDYNPNGKLPISYPRASNDIVLYDHKPMENYESNAYHPLYAFGHGLSYTSFQTSALKLASDTLNMGDTIEVSVDVKNTGIITGKEAVLVYINDVAASVTRPSRQLKAFKKVELAAGQKQTLHFTLKPEDLSFIGVDLKRVIEPGAFKVMVGNETVSFTLKP
jgi:beta-glucosidase